MTGRDLIIYILENKLEDEPIFNNGEFIGFVTEEKAAVLMGVGVSTVHTLVLLDSLEHITIGNSIFIPKYSITSRSNNE